MLKWYCINKRLYFCVLVVSLWFPMRYKDSDIYTYFAKLIYIKIW